MPLQYLKNAAKAPEAQTDHARQVVGEMLALTIIVTAFTLRPRRRGSARATHGAAKVKPK